MDLPDAFWPAVGFKDLKLIRKGRHTRHSGGTGPAPRLELTSPYATRVAWYPEAGAEKGSWKRAVCETPTNGTRCSAWPDIKHEAPHPNGSCGFYAHYTFEGLQRKENSNRLLRATVARGEPKPSPYGAKISAAVLGGGSVYGHESEMDGFRAEYMKIAALLHPGSGVLKELRQIAAALGVPLFFEVDEFVAYAATKGVNLWPMVEEGMRVDELTKIVEG